MLKLLLACVTALDGVGIGLDDGAATADIGPQRRIVEVAAMGLPHGVVEVLYIGEQGDLLHAAARI